MRGPAGPGGFGKGGCVAAVPVEHDALTNPGPRRFQPAHAAVGDGHVRMDRVRGLTVPAATLCSWSVCCRLDPALVVDSRLAVFGSTDGAAGPDLGSVSVTGLSARGAVRVGLATSCAANLMAVSGGWSSPGFEGPAAVVR